jgi:dTMP kinase
VRAGHLIVFEGLDQSGKQTQAERLVAALRERGAEVRFLSFPEYHTAIGAEIGRALHGEREYGSDTLQLLFVANRYEFRPEIERSLADGRIVVCDRYVASTIAYGEAQGLDAEWLTTIQRHMPQPSLTVLLDIAPERSLERKQRARDRYEQDLALLGRVRDSYRRQATHDGWVCLDSSVDRDAVTVAVFSAVRSRLGLL